MGRSRNAIWALIFLLRGELVRFIQASRWRGLRPLCKWHGRLAQLVERFVDIEEVVGSNPIPTTI